MYRSSPSLAHWLPLLLLLAVPALGTAATGGEVYVEADRVEISERDNLSRYEGRVQLRQEGLSIMADRLTIKRADDAIDLIDAVGEPVRISQEATADSAAVDGEAARIQYRPQTGRIVLDGSARVRQGNDEFSGEHIVYDAQHGSVVAESSGSEDDRVRMIFRTDKETEPKRE